MCNFVVQCILCYCNVLTAEQKQTGFLSRMDIFLLHLYSRYGMLTKSSEEISMPLSFPCFIPNVQPLSCLLCEGNKQFYHLQIFYMIAFVTLTVNHERFKITENSATGRNVIHVSFLTHGIYRSLYIAVSNRSLFHLNGHFVHSTLHLSWQIGKRCIK